MISWEYACTHCAEFQTNSPFSMKQELFYFTSVDTWWCLSIDCCSINIRNTEEAVWGSQYSPRLLYWPRGVMGREYCLWGVSYFYYPTIPIFQGFFLFALFGDESEVSLLKYTQNSNTSCCLLRGGSKITGTGHMLCFQNNSYLRAWIPIRSCSTRRPGSRRHSPGPYL